MWEPISWRLGVVGAFHGGSEPASRLEYWVTTSGGTSSGPPTEGHYIAPLPGAGIGFDRTAHGTFDEGSSGRAQLS